MQILNVQGNHWCTVVAASSVVDVYDSMYTQLSDDAKMQIALIVHSEDSSIECRLH